MANKYNAKKVELYGELFDSKAEAQRYFDLKAMERYGEIQNLKRQVVFDLLPNQYVCGHLAERKITYVADFVYEKNGKLIVEDVKGYRDPKSAGYAKYVIKRKLMLYIHHIQVHEVTKNG